MAAQLEYNSCAAALKFELISDSDDIGNWELAYENKKQYGNGFIEFLIGLDQFPKDQITVIFVKNLNSFEYLSENYIDYNNHKFFASIRNNALTSINFYSIFLNENIELRNWDQFFDDEEDTIQFLNKTEIIRNFFKKNRKEYLGLAKNLRSTLAKDMQEDIKYKYYLYANWNYNNIKESAPTCQEELDLYMEANKGGYYMINNAYLNKVVENVHSYDSSSSHIALMARKRFPYGGFKKEEDPIKQLEIIKSNYYSWIGKFYFEGLTQVIPLPIDLIKYGKKIDGNYVLTLLDADWEWFSKVFKWNNNTRIGDFFYSTKKELSREYARMIDDLYQIKDQSPTGTFQKDLNKFRAELPFGQSIKTPTYMREVFYNPETNTFDGAFKDEDFDTVEKRLKKRDYPYQYGLWTVAYSRAELIKLILKIGLDNVIYADTDSVKFIGEEGIKVIEEYNKEITKEFDSINFRRKIGLGDKIGRWQDEGTMKKFKAIGVKWYLFINKKNELEVKASGADKKKLEAYLNNSPNPFEEFDQDFFIDDLFINYVKLLDDKVRKIKIIKQGYIPEKLQKEMDKYNYNTII